MTSKLPQLKALVLVVIVLQFITSCGSSTSNQPATEQGFATIENALKDKFGDNAYYTDLSITYNESIGNIIGVTVTENPESLKMGQWNLTQDNWQQNSDITIEVPQGTKAADYMFQLGNTVSLSKLGSLVEQASQKLKDDKGLKNPTLSIAALNFPNNGNASQAQYAIILKPEHGGTSFQFYYKLNGELIDMDY
jgi:hypothetical protein